jgi:hypothetical protein
MGSFVYKKFIHYCVVYAFGINYGAALRDATVSCQTRTAGGRRAVRSGRRLRGDTRSRCSLLGPRVSLHRGGVLGPASTPQRSNEATRSLQYLCPWPMGRSHLPPGPRPRRPPTNTTATRAPLEERAKDTTQPTSRMSQTHTRSSEIRARSAPPLGPVAVR